MVLNDEQMSNWFGVKHPCSHSLRKHCNRFSPQVFIFLDSSYLLIWTFINCSTLYGLSNIYIFFDVSFHSVCIHRIIFWQVSNTEPLDCLAPARGSETPWRCRFLAKEVGMETFPLRGLRLVSVRNIDEKQIPNSWRFINFLEVHKLTHPKFLVSCFSSMGGS